MKHAFQVFACQSGGTDRLMLAGQGWLFRGHDAKNEAAPAVELSAKLWHIHKDGETWTRGGNEHH